jgi:hypothetical protein
MLIQSGIGARNVDSKFRSIDWVATLLRSSPGINTLIRRPGNTLLVRGRGGTRSDEKLSSLQQGHGSLLFFISKLDEIFSENILYEGYSKGES